MTPREQALARIEEEIEEANEEIERLLKDCELATIDLKTQYRLLIDEKKAQRSAWLTLKAVLELHKPLNRNAYAGPDAEAVVYQICAVCVDGDGWALDFPCPTADLIIKGVLGE